MKILHRVASIEAPGEDLSQEIHGGLSFGDIPGRITRWTKSLNFEIRASGQPPDDLGEVAETLKSLISEKVEDPDNYFTAAEIVELRHRLARLEQRVAELEARGTITELEASDVNRSIEQASKDLPELRKRIWYRLSMNRILGTMKSIIKSQEGREVLKEAVKKLIGLD